MRIRGKAAQALIEELGRAVKGRWAEVTLTADELTREVDVTPFPGAYGAAGWVVTVNGSPPRLVAVVLNRPALADGAPVYLLCGNGSRRISAQGPQRLLALREAILTVVRGRHVGAHIESRRACGGGLGRSVASERG